MQFIFADDKSKYDIIYTDAENESALDLYKDKFSFPLATENFDIYGYVRFSADDGKGVYFKRVADIGEQSGDSFYIHGVERDLTSEYFESAYLKDMFFKFAEVSDIDEIRANSSEITLDESHSDELVALSDDAVLIEHEILKDIVAKIYQGKKVVIAIEDDQFVNENVLLMRKKIYSYLTPSLRKLATYLTGAVASGNFENKIYINVD